MGYNTVEVVIAIASGVVAGSVALVGFGLDSMIEVSSGPPADAHQYADLRFT